MKSIKVTVFGWDGFTCQIPRIKEAMLDLGHNLSEDSPVIFGDGCGDRKRHGHHYGSAWRHRGYSQKS